MSASPSGASAPARTTTPSRFAERTRPTSVSPSADSSGMAEHARERARQLARRLPALVGRLRHALDDYRLQFFRDVRADGSDGRRGVLVVLAGYLRLPGDFVLGVRIERRAPGEHLVHDRAERIDVRPRIAALARPLLRRHVERRSPLRPRARHGRHALRVGDAEVYQLDHAAGV